MNTIYLQPNQFNRAGILARAVRNGRVRAPQLPPHLRPAQLDPVGYVGRVRKTVKGNARGAMGVSPNYWNMTTIDNRWDK